MIIEIVEEVPEQLQ